MLESFATTVFAVPDSVLEFLKAFALGGASLLALARGVVAFADWVLNRLGQDIPDESFTEYAVITALAMLIVATVGEALNIPLIGYQGLFWKMLAALVGALGVYRLR